MDGRVSGLDIAACRSRAERAGVDVDAVEELLLFVESAALEALTPAEEDQ